MSWDYTNIVVSNNKDKLRLRYLEIYVVQNCVQISKYSGFPNCVLLFFNVIRAFEIKIFKWFVEIECTILWYVFELKKKIIKNY